MSDPCRPIIDADAETQARITTLEAENERYRQALTNIQRHLWLAGGELAKRGATYCMAAAALASPSPTPELELVRRKAAAFDKIEALLEQNTRVAFVEWFTPAKGEPRRHIEVIDTGGDEISRGSTLLEAIERTEGR